MEITQSTLIGMQRFDLSPAIQDKNERDRWVAFIDHSRGISARLCKCEHHQVPGAIGVSIKVNFIGHGLEIDIKELDPECLGGGDRMVAQDELESRRSVDGCSAA